MNKLKLIQREGQRLKKKNQNLEEWKFENNIDNFLTLLDLTKISRFRHI